MHIPVACSNLIFLVKPQHLTEVLPLLRTFNPAIVQVLGRVAEQADATFREIEVETTAMLIAVELPRAGTSIVLDRAKLVAYSEQRLRELFVAIWEREAWPRDGMTHVHWQRVVDIALGRTPTWDLPNGVRIAAAKTVVTVGPVAFSKPCPCY